MWLIANDFVLLILFSVIYRTQIWRSYLQRQGLGTLILTINKKKERTKEQKKDQNIFANIYQEH